MKRKPVPDPWIDPVTGQHREGYIENLRSSCREMIHRGHEVDLLEARGLLRWSRRVDGRFALAARKVLPGIVSALDYLIRHVQSQGLLEDALHESVKLQSHYAKLLNMHDGGDRQSFESAEEWINKLQQLSAAKGP